MSKKNKHTSKRLRRREGTSFVNFKKSKNPLNLDKLDELLNSLDALRKYTVVK